MFPVFGFFPCFQDPGKCSRNDKNDVDIFFGGLSGFSILLLCYFLQSYVQYIPYSSAKEITSIVTCAAHAGPHTANQRPSRSPHDLPTHGTPYSARFTVFRFRSHDIYIDLWECTIPSLRSLGCSLCPTCSMFDPIVADFVYLLVSVCLGSMRLQLLVGVIIRLSFPSG